MMQEKKRSEELLELATLDLYRNNLFRILNISVESSVAEVRQRQKRLEMQRKLGVSGGSNKENCFPFDLILSLEKTTRALERINDPVSRCLDEFFWFWGTADDTGLSALEKNDVLGARKSWQVESSRNYVALHNLAILEHIIALEQCEGNDDAVTTACMTWKKLFNSEALWTHVCTRINMVNDARLTIDFAHRLRETLPSIVVLTFVRQTVTFAEQGYVKKPQALLKILRSVDLDTHVIDEAVREALCPFRNRISAAIASAKKRWGKTPQRGDKIIRELHEIVKPLLVIYDCIADSDIARQSVHDEIADAMNMGEVAYCKATNNWREGEKLLLIAQSIAMGQRLQDQIAENIRVDQENFKSANDWCVPGYWDLAPEIIADLEAARTHAESGNFTAALDGLLAMDKRIGAPLKRAIAYCLSVKGVRASNAALNEYNNAETPILKKIMDKLPDRWYLPTPETPSYRLPACLACGSTSYTSWTSLTHKGNKIFMCSSCAIQYNLEINKEKQVFVRALQEPLDYLALAAWVDPKDPGISRNTEVISKLSRENGGSGRGDVDALVKKFIISRKRWVPLAPEGSATDTCFFCGQRQGDPSSAIFVPMCSPLKPLEFIFEKGVECQYGDVIVPRCQVCKKCHAEWPQRVELWHETALREADPVRFPHALHAADNAKNDVDLLTKDLRLAGLSVERAQAAINRATASQNFLFRLLRRPNPALNAAQLAFAAANNQHRFVNERYQAAVKMYTQTQKALMSLRHAAIDTYKSAHEQPQLPDLIRPEIDLLNALAVTRKMKLGWSFGDNQTQGDNVEARGTVSWTPRLRAIDA